MSEGPSGYALYADQMSGVAAVFEAIDTAAGAYTTAAGGLSEAAGQLGGIHEDLVAEQGRADAALPLIDAASGAIQTTDILHPQDERVTTASQRLAAARTKVAKASGRLALAASDAEKQKDPVKQSADRASANAAELRKLLGHLEQFASLAAEAKSYTTPKP